MKARSERAALLQSAQLEHDCSLVLGHNLLTTDVVDVDIVLYDLEAEEHGEGEGEDDDHPGDGLQHHAHHSQPGVADVA